MSGGRQAKPRRTVTPRTTFKLVIRFLVAPRLQTFVASSILSPVLAAALNAGPEHHAGVPHQCFQLARRRHHCRCGSLAQASLCIRAPLHMIFCSGTPFVGIAMGIAQGCNCNKRAPRVLHQLVVRKGGPYINTSKLSVHGRAPESKAALLLSRAPRCRLPPFPSAASPAPAASEGTRP